MIINEKMNVNMSHHYTRKSTNVKVIVTAKRRIPVTRISSSESRIMTSSRLHNNNYYTRDRNRIRSRSKRRSRGRSRIHVHNEVHNVLSQSSGIEYRSSHNSKSTNTNTTNNNNNENRDEFSSMMSNYNNNDSHKFNSADINDDVIADYDVTQVVLDDEEDNGNKDNEDDVDTSNSYGDDNENEPRVNEKEIERLKERFTRRRHEGITMLRERAAMGALREKQPRTSGFGLGRQQTNSTSSSSSSSSSSSGGDGENSSSSSLSCALMSSPSSNNW